LSRCKQHLAAIRMLFDWLVTGQIVATNPAHAVRGPKHVVKTGKITVLTGEQAREPSRRWMRSRSSAMTGLAPASFIGKKALPAVFPTRLSNEMFANCS
jgi:hypothetical protein